MGSNLKFSILVHGRPGNYFSDLINFIRQIDIPLFGSCTEEFSQIYKDNNVEHIVVNDPGALDNDNNGNLNRHIINIRDGLTQINTDLVFRFRADMLLTKWDILNTYLFDLSCRTDLPFMTSSIYTTKPEISNLTLHISDWFDIGLKEKLIERYNIPLQKQELIVSDNGQLHYRNEQYLLIKYLQSCGQNIDIKYDTYHTQELNNKYTKILAKDYILFDPLVSHGFFNTKYPYHRVPETCYSRKDWQKLWLLEN